MITSILTRARTLPMRVKFLMVMWCDFVGRGMNGECDQMKRREALELEEFSWLDLPTDVVELILSRLPIEDEGRLACVCKWWRDIIQTAQPTYPVGKSPLLLHVKSRGEGGGGGKGAIFHYHSPLLNKTFQLGFPLDLRGYEIISAKDGTLMMYNKDEMQMRMVDPLVDYSINFPSITRNISFNGTAIGLHENCYVVFLIDTSHENQVTVHLYQMGWDLDLVYDNGNEPFYLSSNPVYFGGRFYCLGTKDDRVGLFDLSERTWGLYRVKFMNKYDDDDIHCCSYYLVDWIDTVMAVRVKNNGSGIHLFLLDRKKMVWKKTDDLCGRSLFVGPTLSVMSLPTSKRLQNRVFLPHSHQDEPKTAMVVELGTCNDVFLVRSKPSISSKEKNHAATTICCCNNNGEESLYLGSTQDQRDWTIWYQPFYKGLNK